MAFSSGKGYASVLVEILQKSGPLLMQKKIEKKITEENQQQKEHFENQQLRKSTAKMKEKNTSFRKI